MRYIHTRISLTRGGEDNKKQKLEEHSLPLLPTVAEDDEVYKGFMQYTIPFHEDTDMDTYAQFIDMMRHKEYVPTVDHWHQMMFKDLVDLKSEFPEMMKEGVWGQGVSTRLHNEQAKKDMIKAYTRGVYNLSEYLFGEEIKFEIETGETKNPFVMRVIPRVHPPKFLINMSLALFLCDELILSIVLHELAHVVVMYLNNELNKDNDGHHSTWRAIAIRMGAAHFRLTRNQARRIP